MAWHGMRSCNVSIVFQCLEDQAAMMLSAGHNPPSPPEGTPDRLAVALEHVPQGNQGDRGLQPPGAARGRGRVPVVVRAQTETALTKKHFCALQVADRLQRPQREAKV